MAKPKSSVFSTFSSEFSPNFPNDKTGQFPSLKQGHFRSIPLLNYLLGAVKWLWLTQIYGARCRTKSFRTRSSSNTWKLELLILCFHLIYIAIDPFQSDSWLHIPRHLLAANVLASSSNLVTIPLSCSCHPLNPMHCRQFNNTFPLSSFTASRTMKPSQPRQLFWILLRAFCTPTFSPWAAQPPCVAVSNDGCIRPIPKNTTQKTSQMLRKSLQSSHLPISHALLYLFPTSLQFHKVLLMLPPSLPSLPHADFYIH